MTLAEFGAVSEPCALAMALGALRFSRADVAVSVTGIAGPGGGSERKPVGLVDFAAAGPATGSSRSSGASAIRSRQRAHRLARAGAQALGGGAGSS